MRHQFYADSRDAQKWSIILDAARNRSVLWVVMLRPDAGTSGFDANHGQNYQSIEGHEAVSRFFAAERKRIADGHGKDLLRTAFLFEELGVPFQIFNETYPASSKAQDAYFEKVIALLNAREASRRDIVFLDPDNGIAGANAGPEHVRVEHLKSVWAALRPADSLIIYQHQYRQTDWVGTKRKLLEDVVGVPVATFGNGAVRFFVTDK